MASSRAMASAVRLQQALQDYLDDPETAVAFPDTSQRARDLLDKLQTAGVVDRSTPRGRPLTRVSARGVTKQRKRATNYASQNRKLREELKLAKTSKKDGQILMVWSLPQFPSRYLPTVSIRSQNRNVGQ